MTLISMAGALVITFSLLSYGIGSISLQRFKMISPGVLWFLSLGIVLDCIATFLMMQGTLNTPFSEHALIGFSALFVMLINVVLIWRLYLKKGINCFVNKQLLLFSKIAFGWWVVAYFAGSLIVIW